MFPSSLIVVFASVVLLVITSPLKAQEQPHPHPEAEHHQATSPLPPNFLDPSAQPGKDGTVPVDKHHVVGMLIGNLKNGKSFSPKECEKEGAIADLQDAASKSLKHPGKASRFVRAVTEKLNATCEEIKQIAGTISQAESHEHADKVRRAVEDLAVSATGNPPQAQTGQQPPQGLPPFLFGGGPGRIPGGGAGFPGGPAAGPGPFRFGGSGVGQNPFFTVPMTAPALEMDLDRLMFISTPFLGINRAFELARILHVLGSPRSEVFGLQEKFTKNVTDAEANDVMKEYETKLEDKTKSGEITAPASAILQNTAQLSGLNATESHRFARAISQTLGPLNTTQALHIHNVISDHALNHTELRSLTNDIETLNAGTTTPEGATGHDWIFSGNATDGKRSASGLQSRVKMFSAERPCGFAIETDRGTLFPWTATLICSNVQCTGTLVSGSLVLASASCILACGTESVRVVLGDTRLSSCGQRTVEVLATAAVVNPKYKSTQDAQFDIGLVQLQTAVDFNVNPFVYPICLVGVETDDASIECEVVMAAGQAQQVQNSPVNCFQPGNQVCSTNGLTGVTGCVRLHRCFPVSTQASMPVICKRRQNPRYYLWAVTTSSHAASTCTSGVARVSDAFPFIVQGLGF